MAKRERKPKVEQIYQINDDWRIKSDPYCLLLDRRNSKGNWGDITYHPTLKQLLEALLEREIRENIGELQQILKLKDDLLKNIEQYIHAKRSTV